MIIGGPSIANRKLSTKNRLRGLRVTVLGAGRSGLSAAAFLKRQGVHVFISESGRLSATPPPGIDFEDQGHSPRALKADLIIRSPGISNHASILQTARRKGIPVWGELELASRFVRPRHLIAITGTNGKTTTTALAGEIFKAAGVPTVVAGNIGTPLSAVVSHVNRRSHVVVEVSSYQLENIETFHPTVSAILNITPDHLEHHKTMAAYARAKARIFENQTLQNTCVLNADDVWCRRLARRCRAPIFWFSRRRRLRQGVFFEQGDVVLRWRGRHARWKLESRLPGAHNVENILAAVAMAWAARVPLPAIQRTLRRFPGVEHRIEWIRTVKGVSYMNDSKATNVDSTRVALESFAGSLILILGGQGKGSPYTPLRSFIKSKVRHLLLIGEDAPRIQRELGGVVPTDSVGTLAKAVVRASRVAHAGDTVLLSPACASFDQYKNYEERGRHFKTLVRRLRG